MQVVDRRQCTAVCAQLPPRRVASCQFQSRKWSCTVSSTAKHAHLMYLKHSKRLWMALRLQLRAVTAILLHCGGRAADAVSTSTRSSRAPHRRNRLRRGLNQSILASARSQLRHLRKRCGGQLALVAFLRGTCYMPRPGPLPSAQRSRPWQARPVASMIVHEGPPRGRSRYPACLVGGEGRVLPERAMPPACTEL